MTVVVASVACLAVLSGAPWYLPVAVLALAVAPGLGIVAVGVALGVLILRGQSRTATGPVDESMFLREIAGATSAGTTLRLAIADSASRVVDDRTRRLCATGAPMPAIADALTPKLPLAARGFSIIAELSESAGSAVVGALHVLADEADQIGRSRSELRVATAQSRFSAIVVGLVPMGIALGITMVRGVPDPGGAPVVVPMALGAAMMLTGSAVVFVAARRAAR